MWGEAESEGGRAPDVFLEGVRPLHSPPLTLLHPFKDRILFVAQLLPIEAPALIVAVEATQSILLRLHLVEDPHVPSHRHPLVLEVLEAVGVVSAFLHGLFQVAVHEELVHGDGNQPARIDVPRQGARVQLGRDGSWRPCPCVGPRGPWSRRRRPCRTSPRRPCADGVIGRSTSCRRARRPSPW